MKLKLLEVCVMLSPLHVAYVAAGSCSLHEFSCPESPSTCLSAGKRCDGVADCKDNSDEDRCPPTTQRSGLRQTHYSTCSQNQFRCERPSRCVSRTWVCDGEGDCEDASDERDCGNDAVLAMQPASIIGLTVAVAALAVVLAIVAVMLLCLHRKRVNRLTSRAFRRGDAYLVAGREPPPRYSSQDLAQLNPAFLPEPTRCYVGPPPPYHVTPAEMTSYCTSEPPPSYTSRIDSSLDDAGSDTPLSGRRSLARSAATLNESLSLSHISVIAPPTMTAHSNASANVIPMVEPPQTSANEASGAQDIKLLTGQGSLLGLTPLSLIADSQTLRSLEVRQELARQRLQANKRNIATTGVTTASASTTTTASASSGPPRNEVSANARRAAAPSPRSQHDSSRRSSSGPRIFAQPKSSEC